MKANNKICPVCNIKKDAKFFNNHVKAKDGLQYSCKDCEHKRKNAYDANKRELKIKKAISDRINLDGEIWVPITGYEQDYQVSNMGRIYSLRFICIMFQSVRQDNGRSVKLQKDGVHIKSHKVHRLVAKEFVPNPDNKPEVDHIDNNPSNNIYTNLQWGTRGDQIKWAYERGRDRKGGERAVTAKLTNEQVRELRQKYKNGVRFFELKKQYSISESSLSSIIKNRTYKDAI